MINSVLNGRYTILKAVGVGGMSVVYKAVDSLENRYVAIKVLKPEFLSDERFRRRFLNESRAIAMLSHINIVDVYDVNFEGSIQYIVMEYIDGSTLKEYMEYTGALPVGEVIGYIKQILRALRHAHERGVVHRDIKPQNIMLLEDGTIKVTDFGIAHVSNFETITMTDTAIGSVHYISPEQAKGLPTDEKSDIYSTGVMLYEMVTGALPFTGESPVSVALKQVQTPPVRPREVKPDVPEGMEQIILKAMQKDPAKRYQHAKEMLIDIKIFEDNKNWVFDYPEIYTNQPVEEQVNSDPETPPEAITVPEDKQPEAPVDESKKSPKKKLKKPKDKPQQSAKARKWQHIRNKFLAITAGVFLAAVIVLFGLGVMFTVVEQLDESLVELPTFVGQDAYDVEDNPAYEGVFVFTRETRYDDTIGYGLIIEQNPEPGKYSKGTSVRLVVSLGKRQVTVPDVVNWEEAQAVVKLKQSDLLSEIIPEQNDTVKEGYVIRTVPASPSSVDVGTTVKIYVSFSSEVKMVRMPGVEGLSLDLARTMLYNNQLYYIKVNYEYSDSVAKDKVISQSIEKETEIEIGTEITLVVSGGTLAEAIASGTYSEEENEFYDTNE